MISWIAFLLLAMPVSAQNLRPGFVDPVDDFAAKLSTAKSDDDRSALLAANKDLINIRLRRALIQRGNVLITTGQYAKAFDVYHLAKRVAEQIGDKDGIATATLDIGTVHYLQANLSSALEHYNEARALFVQSGNNYEAAKALSGVALIYKERRRDDEALKAFSQVFKEFEGLNDKEEMANAMSSIGAIYYEQRKFAEASNAFMKSAELNATPENTIRIADAFYMQGDYPEALNNYQKSLASIDYGANPAAAISALTGAANSAYYQGNYDDALDYFQKNLRIQQAQQDELGVVTSLRGAGNVYRSRGDFGAALKNYQQSLTLGEKIKAPRGTTLANVGLVRTLQGENSLALENYGKALAEFEETDNKIDQARVLSLIGNVRYAQSDYESALGSYRRSLVLREAMDDKPGTADLLVGIGTTNLRKKAYAESLDSYQKALKLFESINHKEGAARTVSRIADAYLQQSKYDEALNFAERAEVLAKQIQSNDVLWYARILIGKAQRGLNNPPQALQSFKEATAIVESLRARPAVAESVDRSGVLPFLAAVDLLVEQGRTAEAFDYAERSKIQSLFEMLRRNNAQSIKHLSAAELAEERKLSGNAVSVGLLLEREALSTTSNENRRAALRERLNQARIAYENFRKRLYLAHPSLKIERGETNTLESAALRSLINDDRAAILEYVATENSVYLFVLTAGDRKTGNRSRGGAVALNAYPLTITRTVLTERVKALHQLLSTRDDSFHPLARGMYDLLLRPADKQLAGKTKLLIVPDGALWRLPFEALQPTDDQYLSDQAAISYAPSLSTLREMMKQRAPAARIRAFDVSAFASPELSKDFERGLELTYTSHALEPTVEHEKEVQSLRTVYGDSKTRSFTGEQASEERARLEIARASILHFAAPALLDDVSPMFSFIALSSKTGDSVNDGLLQSKEIINLQTPARLVVFSASQVRNDTIANGDAAIGLAWSWYVAGSPAVAFSRWQVKSESATQLMTAFHAGLRSRTVGTKALALQQAAMKNRRSNAHQHPYYWAAFSIIGDPR